MGNGRWGSPAGDLLIVTAERPVQVRQYEPLQLVPDFLFPGQIEHRSLSHAPYRSCTGRHEQRADHGPGKMPH
jgi:hypothetical protein